MREDHFDNGIDIREDIDVRNAQHSPAERFQISVSACITRDLVAIAVRGAIDFDDQIALDVCEVGDERRDRVLPPE